MQVHFPSLGSFLDPQLTSDGKPYGPIRYKEIVRERYWLTKNLNTSYNDLGEITPLERYYLLEFLAEEIKKAKEVAEKRKQETKSK